MPFEAKEQDMLNQSHCEMADGIHLDCTYCWGTYLLLPKSERLSLRKEASPLPCFKVISSHKAPRFVSFIAAMCSKESTRRKSKPVKLVFVLSKQLL